MKRPISGVSKSPLAGLERDDPAVDEQNAAVAHSLLGRSTSACGRISVDASERVHQTFFRPEDVLGFAHQRGRLIGSAVLSITMALYSMLSSIVEDRVVLARDSSLVGSLDLLRRAPRRRSQRMLM
jgi:hypothetical protein